MHNTIKVCGHFMLTCFKSDSHNLRGVWGRRGYKNVHQNDMCLKRLKQVLAKKKIVIHSKLNNQHNRGQAPAEGLGSGTSIE